MRLRLLLVLLAALVLVAPARARVRDLGASPPVLRSDGGSLLVAWGARGRVVRVVDVATGRRWWVPVPASCRPNGTGRGVVVLDCAPPAVPDGERRAVRGEVMDLQTGARSALPPLRFDTSSILADADAVSFEDVGAAWVRLHVSGYHWEVSGYLSRATGEIRGEPERGVADLDRPGLARRLCAPLRQRAVGGAYASAVWRLSLAGPRAAAVEADDTDGSPEQVALQQCGHPLQVLARCRPGGCGGLVLDDRTVAWTQVRSHEDCATVVIWSLRTSRHVTLPRPCGPTPLALVRHRLFGVGHGHLLELRP